MCSKSQWFGIIGDGTCQRCSGLKPPTMYLACVLCKTPFYFDGYACVLAANIPNMSTTSTITACPANFIARLSPVTNQTIKCVCSIAAGYYTSNNSCLSCTLQPVPGVATANCLACSVTSGFYNTSR